MADRLQRRRRRRKRARWLAIMAEGGHQHRTFWTWAMIYGSTPPPKHSIAIYDIGSPADGS